LKPFGYKGFLEAAKWSGVATENRSNAHAPSFPSAIAVSASIIRCLCSGWVLAGTCKAAPILFGTFVATVITAFGGVGDVGRSVRQISQSFDFRGKTGIISN